MFFDISTIATVTVNLLMYSCTVSVSRLISLSIYELAVPNQTVQDPFHSAKPLCQFWDFWHPSVILSLCLYCCRHLKMNTSGRVWPRQMKESKL